MLNVLDHLPQGLLSLSATELHRLLPGPTLIHLPGRRTPAAFVAVLQHGNEHTGWEALRRLLSQYADKRLPRALSIFIGNVSAARHNQRFLPGQQDFNRCWGAPGSAPHPLMAQVLAAMRSRGVFLSVDVHNNTGKNPHYACVNRTDVRFLHLARLFARTAVFFVRPEGVQSMAFAKLCPSVTIECGLSGDAAGEAHTLEYLHACLNLAAWPERALDPADIDLYHTVAVVKVPPQLSLLFGDGEADICLPKDLEFSNFRELPVGTVLGRVRPGIQPFDIRDEVGAPVADAFIRIQDQQIVTAKPFIPAMITRDISVIRKDCLCYLMEPYTAEG